MAALRGLHDRTERARLRLLADLGVPAEPIVVHPPADTGTTGSILAR
jgi:hypothetical protein